MTQPPLVLASRRKVEPPCREELERLYVDAGFSFRQLGRRFGVNGSSVRNWILAAGITPRTNRQRGPGHHQWKGGRWLRADGYVDAAAPGHHRADKGSRVLEHILVAEEKYGRLIYRNEVVHHINFNKSDNRPENLVVCSNRTNVLWHSGVAALGKQLFERGIIAFDESRGYYLVGDE